MNKQSPVPTRAPALAAMYCCAVFSLFAARAGGHDGEAAAQKDPFAGVATAAPSSSTATQAALVWRHDESIAKAIRDTLADNPGLGRPGTGTALSGESESYTKFVRRFDQAAKGHCLGPDALKHQPSSRVVRTVVGDFVVGVGGMFALPFWGAAVLRGKCSWRP